MQDSLQTRPRIQVLVRNSCFAVLSAIEADLRDLVRVSAERSGRVELLPVAVRERAAKRWADDEATRAASAPNSDLDLLHYTDFSDLAALMRLIEGSVPELSVERMRQVANRLERLSPARNRVCHTRPLEPDDFSSLMDFAQYLRERAVGVPWPTLEAALEQLRTDPAAVLGLQIPSFWSAELPRILHNLPFPEWDDTGFLGRDADRRELTRRLLSAYPVVNVVGEGGVGKTALALRCLYDLLEQPAIPFDAIVWVTLKTRALTAAGVKDMQDAINSTLGLTQAVVQVLAGPAAASNVGSLLDEVVDYLAEFKILVAIDNFETVTPDDFRPLLANVPAGSKVLLTSRIALGEFEFRYELDPLDPRVADDLARRYARTFNLKEIAEASGDVLRSFCDALHNNPLLIRWFVSSVANGADPQQLLLRRGKPYVDVLRFCFENLFGRLTTTEQVIIHILASARRPLSLTELLFLTEELDRDDVQWALNTLHHSSMLRRQLATGRGRSVQSTTYTLTEIASEYVELCAPPQSGLYEKVRTLLRQLKDMVDEQVARAGARLHDLDVVRAATRDEVIAAVHLRQALTALAQRDFASARTSVERARLLAPGYSESYRIAARIEEEAGDTFKAATEYESAIECDPDSVLARYHHAQFLSRALSNQDEALSELERALQLEPNELALHAAKAGVLTLAGRASEAADLYQRLVLPSLPNQHRRFRLTVRSEAADCYTRLAVQARNMRDQPAFEMNLQRALEQYELAFDRDDHDDALVTEFAALLNLAMEVSTEWKDVAIGRRVTEILGRTNSKYENKVLEMPAYKNFDAKFAQDKTIRDGLGRLRLAIAQTPAPPLDAIPLEGEIRGLTPGTLYGYIRDTSAKSWFFHRNNLVQKEMWPRLSIGSRVRFTRGQNRLGECADRVLVIELAPPVPTLLGT